MSSGSSLTIFLERLRQRRGRLNMSCATVAERAGLSLPTVQRILCGKEKRPSFANVLAIAESLGVALEFKETPADQFEEQEAARKARKLVRMVQATSALESQAVSEDHLAAMERRTACELLAGSRRKLWGK